MNALGTKNLVLLGGFVVILALAVVLFMLPTPGQAPDQNNTVVIESSVNTADYTLDNCVADECLAVTGATFPTEKLPEAGEQILLEALDDTYKAIALYSAAIFELGDISPFINIIRTEQHYVAAQKALLDKYGIPVPDNVRIEEAITPEDITKPEACRVLLAFERESVKLYNEKILPAVVNRPDMAKVLGAINAASTDLHVPALAACAE